MKKSPYLIVTGKFLVWYCNAIPLPPTLNDLNEWCYRAMFSLRNKGTKDAVEVLCEALTRENECNHLFKHEICYVLGQLEHEAATSALISVVEDTHEHEMVRHEAVESLGAIGGEIRIYIHDEYSTSFDYC